jgi:hypothetical protein
MQLCAALPGPALFGSLPLPAKAVIETDTLIRGFP